MLELLPVVLHWEDIYIQPHECDKGRMAKTHSIPSSV